MTPCFSRIASKKDREKTQNSPGSARQMSGLLLRRRGAAAPLAVATRARVTVGLLADDATALGAVIPGRWAIDMCADASMLVRIARAGEREEGCGM